MPNIGISSDIEFCDYLYRCECFKDITKDSNSTVEERERASHDASRAYILAIRVCVNKIIQTQDAPTVQAEYLDWLRWNEVLINDALDGYQGVQNGINNLDTEYVNSLKKDVATIKRNFFHFNESEKGVINEYIHAYELAKKRNEPRLWRQSGSLFLNYLFQLQTKFYIENFGRDGVTFDTLEVEAKNIINNLKIYNDELFSDVNLAWEAYSMFRAGDSTSRVAQDLILGDAIKLAHVRATETGLQRALRLLDDAIAYIKSRLAQAMTESLAVGRLMVNPISHPLDFLNNVWYCMQHPLNSIQAMVSWAKDNPFRACTLIVGGLVIGVLTGGLASGALISLPIIAEVPIAAGAGVMATFVTATSWLAQAAGVAGQLVDNAKREESPYQLEKDRLIKDRDDAGNKLSAGINQLEYVRTRMHIARESAEREASILEQARQEQERVNQERQRQIDNMLTADLSERLQEMNEFANNAELQLEQARLDQQRLFRIFAENQTDAHTIRSHAAESSVVLERIRRRQLNP